jgi:hypothetical protein
MQQDKTNKKIEQISKLSEDNSEILKSISKVISKFIPNRRSNPINKFKKKGPLLTAAIYELILIPFLGCSSVIDLINSKSNRSGIKKDALYSLKNNENIDWRSFVWGIVKLFTKYSAEIDKDIESKPIKAVIFDDTVLPKEGFKIEGSGYVHDHCLNGFRLGFKLLVCGYWNGYSHIPVDFSIHKEKRDKEIKKVANRIDKQKERLNSQKEYINTLKNTLKENSNELKRTQLKGESTKLNEKKLKSIINKRNRITGKITASRFKLANLRQKLENLKNQERELKQKHKEAGLSKKQLSQQFKKKRKKDLPGAKRKNELLLSKIDSLVEMLKACVENKLLFDYVLTDSWFFSEKLLKAVKEIGQYAHLVSMAKHGVYKFKIQENNKYYTGKELVVKKQRKFSKRSKKYKSTYFSTIAEYQGIKVKVYSVQFGKSKEWKSFVTTELNMSFNKLMEVYKIRWTIEVFFKECKQYLHLGKCQSNDFDAQIADTSLSLIRYILLSYCERISYGLTIGGLFRKLSQASITENLVADISENLLNILKAFAKFISLNFYEMFVQILRNDEYVEELKNLFYFLTTGSSRVNSV